MRSPAEKAFSTALHLFQVGDLQRAESSCRLILAQQPNSANVLDLLGLVAYRRGDFTEATQCVRLAITISPDTSEYHVHLGQAYRAAGDYAAAISSGKDAVRISPDSDYANNCLGLALMEEQDFAGALDCFELAVHAAPGNGDAHNNRGVAMFGLERYDEAVSSYGRAVAINPSAVGPLTNLGNVLHVVGKLNEAQACFLKVLRLQPASKEAHNNLGNVCRDQGQLEDAAAHYGAAIDLDARFVPAHRNLGNVREQQQQFTNARSSYREVEMLRPDAPLRGLRNKTMCPTVFHSNAEIDGYRRQLLSAIERSTGSDRQIDLAEIALCGETPPFNLMYQGRQDLPIKRAYANLFRGRMPQTRPWPVTGKARLGFVVTQGHEVAFANCMGHVLEQIEEDELDVRVVCTIRSAAVIQSVLDRDLLRFALIPQPLDQAAGAIREHRFDLLYYWEVGSDVTNYFLPHLRLAPIQCTSWGVPVTSGIPTVDYYLESRLLATEANAADYTEQLIHLDTLPTSPEPTTETAFPRSRESFGFGEQDTIYLCAQNLAKVHPDFDALVADILRTDPLGRVVFIADHLGYVAQQLEERLRRSAADVHRRIRFLPRLDAGEYRCLLAASDVLLDTIHYGGIMTTYDALALAKPIVTLEGSDQRSRYAAACYRLMGVTDCIAASAERYVAIASRLGTEKDYRRAIVEKLAAATGRLFADRTVAPAYVNVFRGMLAKLGRL